MIPIAEHWYWLNDTIERQAKLHPFLSQDSYKSNHTKTPLSTLLELASNWGNNKCTIALSSHLLFALCLFKDNKSKQKQITQNSFPLPNITKQKNKYNQINYFLGKYSWINDKHHLHFAILFTTTLSTAGSWLLKTSVSLFFFQLCAKVCSFLHHFPPFKYGKDLLKTLKRNPIYSILTDQPTLIIVNYALKKTVPGSPSIQFVADISVIETSSSYCS